MCAFHNRQKASRLCAMSRLIWVGFEGHFALRTSLQSTNDAHIWLPYDNSCLRVYLLNAKTHSYGAHSNKIWQFPAIAFKQVKLVYTGFTESLTITGFHWVKVGHMITASGRLVSTVLCDIIYHITSLSKCFIG